MDSTEIVAVESDSDNEYDSHKLVKMLLTAGAAWLCGRGIELAYDSFRERRNDKTEIDE